MPFTHVDVACEHFHHSNAALKLTSGMLRTRTELQISASRRRARRGYSPTIPRCASVIRMASTGALRTARRPTTRWAILRRSRAWRRRVGGGIRRCRSTLLLEASRGRTGFAIGFRWGRGRLCPLLALQPPCLCRSRLQCLWSCLHQHLELQTMVI